MLNCKLNKPVNTICDTSVAGILKIAALNYDEAHKFTTSADGCEVDTIELANGEKFIPIEVVDNSAYFNTNLVAGGNGDQKAIQHQVGGVLSRIDCDLLGDWKNWLLGRLVFAVMTKNHQVFILGANNGLTSTNFDYASGTATADASGVTFLFEGPQREPALLVKDWEVIKALFITNTEVGG